MRVIAFDLSLTRTGVADSFSPPKPFVLAPPGGLVSWPRIRWIQARVQELLADADLLCIEGYAYGSNNAVYAGELGGIIRFTAYCMGVRYVDIAPTTLKKLATGSGKGKKLGVLVEAVKRLGYEGQDDNEADAMWLLQAALHHYGLPGAVDLPKAHTSTLHKIKWPTPEELEAA